MSTETQIIPVAADNARAANTRPSGAAPPDVATPVPASTPSAASPEEDKLYQRQCFERHEARIRAVEVDPAAHYAVDAIFAVTVVLAAEPLFKTLRPAMEKLKEVIDLTLVDIIAELAYALSWVNVRYVRLASSEESLDALYDEGLKLRELMANFADFCFKQGYVKGQLSAPLRRQAGRRNVAQDLTTLCGFYDAAVDELTGKIPITRENLKRADHIARALLAGAAAKDVAPGELSEVATLRQQAFTLFMQAYGELRDGAFIVRRKEGDFEKFVPSVYKRGKSKAKSEPENEPQVSAPPAVPSVPPVTPAPAASAPESSAPVPVGHLR